MQHSSPRPHALWLYAGLLAFLPHLLAAIYATAARPGFSHQTQFLSELGERGAIHAAAFNHLGILPTAILIFIFGVGLALTYKSHRLLIAAGALIALHGVFRSVAAAFPCDLGCRPLVPTTGQLVHNVAATLAFVSLTSAVFTAGAWMLKTRQSRAVAAITYALGILAVFSQTLLVLHHGGPAGLYQRVALGALQLWVSLMALRLLSSSRNGI